MARTSPLSKLHERASAHTAPYPPPFSASGAAPGPTAAAPELVLSYGQIEIEYAAIRKGAVLLDQPHRGTLSLTGPDAVAFLDSMLTQKLSDLPEFGSRRSFWLNRKGRIESDIRVCRLSGNEVLLEVDAHRIEQTLQTLDAFLLADDAQFQDRTETTHRLGLHGPIACALLSSQSQPAEGPAVQTLVDGAACRVTIAGKAVVVERQDSLGVPGFELLTAVDAAESVYTQLLTAGKSAPPSTDAVSSLGNTYGGATPAGWHAANIARVEAGHPLFLIDFGPDAIPNETGLLEDRVSFTKGCYLGQEIVARLHSRGGPKRVLAALRCDRVLSAPVGDAPASPIQPVTGDAVYASADADASAQGGVPASEPKPIGAVTSSALSPMLGDVPVCFAVVSPAAASPGTAVRVSCDGTDLVARVLDGLPAWSPEPTA